LAFFHQSAGIPSVLLSAGESGVSFLASGELQEKRKRKQNEREDKNFIICFINY